MGKVDKEFDAYLAEARSWETSSVLALRKSVRTAWRVAAAGATVGVLGIGAATVQSTQEPPLPVVLRVDSTTGIVDRVNSLSEGKITTSEATDKYFAQLYVRYRESWDPALVDPKTYTEDTNFYAAALMSTVAEQAKYDAFYKRSNQSPRQLYGASAKVRIEIKGTSFLAPGVASVRYMRVVERPATTAIEVSHHTATVTFSYSSGRMNERDRTINPLGFQADYRTDPDTPGLPPQLVDRRPASVSVAAPPAPPAPAAAQLDLQPLMPREQ